ncbi:MAG: spirocyclase AveC family protein [Acidocella sp.]|nr:spirocyclase AveC family protein [Acidocella sp.]
MTNSISTDPAAIPEAKASRGFAGWVILGVAVLCVQIYTYAAWVMSPDFRPTPPGSDPMPAIAHVSIAGYELFSMLILIPVVVWFVYGVAKTGKIDITRALMVGWLSAYWLDPYLNVLRPMFTYNASAVNFGSWASHIPFWHSAGGARIAEPLLIIAPSYFYTFSTTALIAVWVMNRAEMLRPGLKWAGLLLAGFIGVWFTMELLDIVATRYMGLDAWPGSVQSLSLWGGAFYQFPIYELIFFPSPFVACAFLIRSADARGDTAIERGISAMAGPQWRRNMFRIFAFVAFCNVCNFAYTGGMALTSLAANPWPAGVPSWLADGQCGAFTGLPCKP